MKNVILEIIRKSSLFMMIIAHMFVIFSFFQEGVSHQFKFYGTIGMYLILVFYTATELIKMHRSHNEWSFKIILAIAMTIAVFIPYSMYKTPFAFAGCVFTTGKYKGEYEIDLWINHSALFAMYLVINIACKFVWYKQSLKDQVI